MITVLLRSRANTTAAFPLSQQNLTVKLLSQNIQCPSSRCNLQMDDSTLPQFSEILQSDAKRNSDVSLKVVCQIYRQTYTRTLVIASLTNIIHHFDTCVFFYRGIYVLSAIETKIDFICVVIAGV